MLIKLWDDQYVDHAAVVAVKANPSYPTGIGNSMTSPNVAVRLDPSKYKEIEGGSILRFKCETFGEAQTIAKAIVETINRGCIESDIPARWPG